MPGTVSAYNPSQDELDEIYDGLVSGMQKTGWSYASLNSANPSVDLKLAADWVRCVTLPEDNVEFPVRFHDANAQAATAALTVVTPYSFAWQAQPTNSAGINATIGPSDAGIFLFDDHPGCIACITDPNASY